MTESRPTADRVILETRVYRGANVWSYDKAIHLVVDLGVLEDYPTNTLPGFTDRLLESLPALREHSCSRGRRGGFVASCRFVAGRPVGFVGSAARHHELGPIALGLVKRNVPLAAVLEIDGMPAAQEVVVDPEVGLHVRPDLR